MPRLDSLQPYTPLAVPATKQGYANQKTVRIGRMLLVESLLFNPEKSLLSGNQTLVNFARQVAVLNQ